jgi:hypothetical protein
MDNKKTTRHFEITGLSTVLGIGVSIVVRGLLIGLAICLLPLRLVLTGAILLVKV